jgi:glucose-6-phosphate isomerase
MPGDVLIHQTPRRKDECMSTESIVPDGEINRAFSIFFNLKDGASPATNSTKRHLSDVKQIFVDATEAERILERENPLVYEFYELGIPSHPGDLAFGTSITYPGKVAGEFYMTKGHFHQILETAEVYYCIQGRGFMMMENPEGKWDCQELTPGRAVYVPKRFAHRSINIGDTPFITFFCFRADAGHDYKTIEAKGFRKIVVEGNEKPEIIDNPKWK